MLNLDSCISRNSDIAWQIIDGKAMLVIPGEPALCTLNSTGTRIWALLDEPKKIEEIVEKLCEEFDVSEEETTREVVEFTEKLLSEGVVVVK